MIPPQAKSSRHHQPPCPVVSPCVLHLPYWCINLFQNIEPMPSSFWILQNFLSNAPPNRLFPIAHVTVPFLEIARIGCLSPVYGHWISALESFLESSLWPSLHFLLLEREHDSASRSGWRNARDISSRCPLPVRPFRHR